MQHLKAPILLHLVLTTCVACSTHQAIAPSQNIERQPALSIISLTGEDEIAPLRGENTEKSCETFKKLNLTAENQSVRDLANYKRLIFCKDKVTTEEASKLYLPPQFSWQKNAWLDARIYFEVIGILTSPQLSELLHDKLSLFANNRERLEYLNLLEKKAIHNEIQEILVKQKYKFAPRLNPQETNHLRIANDYLNNREFSKAKKHFQKIIASNESEDEIIQAFKGIFNADKKANASDRLLLKTLNKFNLWLDKNLKDLSAKQKFDTQLFLARSLWNSNSNKSALREINYLYKISNTVEQKITSVLLLARIQDQFKNKKATLAALNDLLKLCPVENLHPDCIRGRWYNVWTLRSWKQFELAEKSALELIKSDDSIERMRARFWLAYWNEKSKPEVAKKYFQENFADDPMGFYGQYSQIKSEQSLPAIKLRKMHIQEFQDADFLRDIKNDLGKLITANEFDLVNQITYSHGINLVLKNDFEKLEEVFMVLASLDGAAYAIDLLSRLPIQIRTQYLRKIPEAFYPKIFENTVMDSSQKLKMDPAVIWSVMRRESGFNPRVRSDADAFGLMQITENSANNSKKSCGGNFKTFNDLFEPEINILFGTCEIKALTTKYKLLPFVFAGYNANAKKITEWKGKLEANDLFYFIENITYAETQSYVRAVLSNWLIYRRIIEGEIKINESDLLIK